MKPLLILSFVGLQIADVATTAHVLAAGGWEANPIQAAAQAGLGLAGAGALKLALMVACALVMCRWRVRYITPAVALMGLVVINNLVQ